MDTSADPLECKTADVVPVEPDEDCFAPNVVVGNEAPVAAVVAFVAVVAQHQIASGGHLAAEPAIIVNAVLLPGERPYVERIHRLRRRVLGDRVRLATPALGEPFGGHVGKAFETTERLTERW